MALIGYYNLMWVTVVKEKIIMRREIIMLIMMNAQVLQFYLNMTFFFLKPSQSPLLLTHRKRLKAQLYKSDIWSL